MSPIIKTLSPESDEYQTNWPEFRQAHQPDEPGYREAQRDLIRRYTPAIRRYLKGATRDSHLAEELFQDFVVNFVKGAYHNARPEKGRFRNYLKTSLANMVSQHRRRAATKEVPCVVLDHDPVDHRGRNSLDTGFEQEWLQTMIDAVWAQLKAEERRGGEPGYWLLRLKSRFPGLRSAQLAVIVERRFGKRVDEDWVRQRQHRTRKHFKRLFVDEVAKSLTSPDSIADLADELDELGYLDSCRKALRRRIRSSRRLAHTAG